MATHQVVWHGDAIVQQANLGQDNKPKRPDIVRLLYLLASTAQLFYGSSSSGQSGDPTPDNSVTHAATSSLLATAKHVQQYKFCYTSASFCSLGLQLSGWLSTIKSQTLLSIVSKVLG